MSMGRVFSCVVGRGYMPWPVCSLGKTVLAFALHNNQKEKKKSSPNVSSFLFVFLEGLMQGPGKQNIEKRTFPSQEPTSNPGASDLSSSTSRNWIQPIIWMSLEADLSSESIDKNLVILTFWILALWEGNQRSLSKPTQTSELQSCELINGYCFRPLNLQWFVAQC